jgi:hypothetical protein
MKNAVPTLSPVLSYFAFIIINNQYSKPGNRHQQGAGLCAGETGWLRKKGVCFCVLLLKPDFIYPGGNLALWRR